MEDFKNEEKFLRNGIVINPDEVDAWLNLGLNLFCQNRTLECIDIWQKSIDMFGLLDENVCSDLAECYFTTNQYDKALDLSLKTIEKFDNLLAIYEVIGKVYLLKKDEEKAIHYFQIYLDLLELEDEDDYIDEELRSYIFKNKFRNIEELYVLISKIFGEGWKYHIREGFNSFGKIKVGEEYSRSLFIDTNPDIGAE